MKKYYEYDSYLVIQYFTNTLEDLEIVDYMDCWNRYYSNYYDLNFIKELV